VSRAQSAGIVSRDASRRPHRLVAARTSPLFEPLHDLLQRTIGVEAELRAVLSVDGVDVAAIHGSWANPPRRPDSDIDVIVVGNASLRDLRRRVRGAGARAGRSIDLTLFSPDELRGRHASGNGFIRRLLEKPVIPLVGDLGAALGK
jgi:predicted nucleotidyltransferase